MSVSSVVASVPDTIWPAKSLTRLTWSETKRTVMSARLPVSAASSIVADWIGLDLADLDVARLLARGDREFEGTVNLVGEQIAQPHPVACGEGGDDHPEGALGAVEEARRVEIAVDAAHSRERLTRAAFPRLAAGGRRLRGARRVLR